MKSLEMLVVASAFAALAACSTAVDKTSAGFSDAAMSPLTDLNLRRNEIPPLLANIRSPYEPIPQVSCAAIGQMVADLDAILGRDFDAIPLPEKSLGDHAGEGAADLTLGTVSSTMSDFIPFRSLVREATGASAHERRVRAAFQGGVARRSYLKGVGAQLGCAPPAAPDPTSGFTVSPEKKVEYRSNVQPR
jgi:hypothetical protein